MQWSNKKVFVTGAGGFIGSHLCERLVHIGADVTALIRYNSRGSHGFLDDSSKEIKEKINVVLGDIRDENAFRLHLKEQDVVFHLAAIPGIPYSFLYPRDVFEINTLGSLNLLNSARQVKPQKIILVSSAETYGDAQYVPMDEQHPQFPKSPYAASKAAMEKLGLSFLYSYELPITIVRLFNNFGPRQSARAVTPTIITQMLTGSEVRVGSLHPKRDFTFVLDTVEALIKIAELTHHGDIFNIGSNVSFSVQEIIDKVATILDKKIKIITEESRIRPHESEVMALQADNKHLKSKTGWHPQYTYEQGLNKTVDWIAENMNLYKTDIYNV